MRQIYEVIYFYVYLFLHLQIFAFFAWTYCLQAQIQVAGSYK